MEIVLQSTTTCPECGFARDETMPTNVCVYFWDCPACGALIQPKPGDCCAKGWFTARRSRRLVTWAAVVNRYEGRQ